MGDLHHPPLFASQPAAGLHLRLTLPLETRGVLLFQLMDLKFSFAITKPIIVMFYKLNL